MTLLFDVARCNGILCLQRDGCRRYLERAHVGPRTPTYENMCGNTPAECYISNVQYYDANSRSMNEISEDEANASTAQRIRNHEAWGKS